MKESTKKRRKKAFVSFAAKLRQFVLQSGYHENVIDCLDGCFEIFVVNADEPTLERLRTVKWFFDCGDDDYLFNLSVKIYQEMRQRKVKAELRVRDGWHCWEYWHQALRMALPFASRNFGNPDA